MSAVRSHVDASTSGGAHLGGVDLAMLVCAALGVPAVMLATEPFAAAETFSSVLKPGRSVGGASAE